MRPTSWSCYKGYRLNKNIYKAPSTHSRYLTNSDLPSLQPELLNNQIP